MGMRQTMTVSLPAATVKKVRSHISEGNYASVSEFFRDLLRRFEDEKILKQIHLNKSKAKPIKLTSFDAWR